MPLSRRLALNLALAVLVALVYWPGVSGGFLFDDFPNIVQKDAIHANAVEWAQIRDAIGSFGHGFGRAIPLASFAVDHVFWQLDAEGYKRTSLFIHILNALLVVQLFRTLLPLAGANGRASTLVAFVLGAVWAVHPLQVSTVLYVVQRMEIMSTTFVLLALLTYLKARQNQIHGRRAWGWLATTIGLVLLALACKESAIAFPAYTLALELTLLGFRSKSTSTTRNWKILYGASLLIGMALVIALIPRFASAEIYAIRDYDAYERLLTQARVLPMYLWWILAPAPSQYHFYYDNFVASTALFTPWTTAAGSAALLAISAAALFKLKSRPLFSLGILWFLGAHAVTSSYLPLELVFEHRNYLAIVGILLAVYDLTRRYRSEDVAKLAATISITLILGLGSICAIRSATWGNPLQLAMDLSARNPGSVRASTDLGEQYMILAGNDTESPYYLMAEREFERGAGIPGSGPLPEQGLILLAASAGVEAKPEWWDRMVEKFETRVLGPQELTMIVGFLEMEAKGLPLDNTRLSEAYAALARRASMPASQYYAFGLHALERAGDPALAAELFKSAVDHAEGDRDLIQSLANALASGGHQAEAEIIVDYASRSAGIEIETPRMVEVAD